MTLKQVTVTIENLAPENGTFLTPFWVGFHNGFDTYDRGRPVSPGLESLAEDGDNSLITTEFAFSGQGQVDGTIGNDAIAPRETVSQTFNIDTSLGNARFFNYASMVLPSNDTFIANGNEFAHEVFDENGNFIPLDFLVSGSQALDAGSEVNDELPANTAFFGQEAPNTGVAQNEGVQPATGFLPPGSGGILDAPMFANADYTANGYQFARIMVTSEPSAQLTSSLDSSQEVEPGDPDARGTSELILNEVGDALSYSLTVSELDFGAFIGDGTPLTSDPSDDVTRVHIHNQVRGENGPIVFGLIDDVDPAFDDQDNDDLNITLNSDGSTTLTGIWEENDLATTALSTFVEEIRSADPGEDIALYWNVHTNEFPAGAIRGQLQGSDELGRVIVGMNLIDADGIGAKIGTIKAEDTQYGLLLTPNLSGLTPGVHGFHVHENPDCSPGVRDGEVVPALAAGGHYDPENTGRHEGPYGDGHLGDLPPLIVGADRTATLPLLAPRLEVADLTGRSLMIHQGGDNFSDLPDPLGGGGARIACGVV